MVRKVIWTEAATRDLEATVVFVAEDSEQYARAIFQNARSAASSLKKLPERGRYVPEVARRDIRELFVHQFRLIYKVGPESVHILAFIHGARDFSAAWTRRVPE